MIFFVQRSINPTATLKRQTFRLKVASCISMKLVLLMIGLARADLAVCPGEGARYEAVGLGFHRHH